jgi:hypothetical protein
MTGRRRALRFDCSHERVESLRRRMAAAVGPCGRNDRTAVVTAAARGRRARGDGDVCMVTETEPKSLRGTR